MINFATPYTPEEAGYEASRIAILNEHYEKIISANEIQCAVYCLSRHGKIFAHTAIGKQSYEKDDNRLVTPDAIFGIASVTKSFVGVAIMKLVEDGKLRLGQSVCEIIDEFNAPGYNKINIAHLLTHTSGINPDGGVYSDVKYLNAWELIENASKKGNSNWIDAALHAYKRNTPGKEWSYSSFGYIILGEIITRISGIKAEDYIIENIVKPLRMDDTGFEFTKDKLDKVIINSEWRKKHIGDIRNDVVEEKSIWDELPKTGGGMVSSVLDLNKFGQMLCNKGRLGDVRILSRKAVERMTENHTPGAIDYTWGSDGVTRDYGMGVDLRRNLNNIFSAGTFFHEGAGACSMIVDPSEGMVASFAVPFVDDGWFISALDMASSIMWSGII